MQIQSKEKPKYDNIFVNMGAFHIEMAFFKVLGKYIAESGAPFILNESQVLEKGSMKGFMKGKSYNRGKRVHQFLSVAKQVLHLRQYLQQHSESLVHLTVQHEISRIKRAIQFDTNNISRELNDFLEDYRAYSDDTSNGKHGKTAPFWIRYVMLVNLYHEVSRSIRMGDLDLYKYCLPKLADFFFTFNHHNYSKWIVRYHVNVMLNTTHPC